MASSILLTQAHTTEANIGERTAFDLWHHRLGHPNMRILQNVISTNGLPALSVNKIISCDACLSSKSHRLPYSKSTHHTTREGQRPTDCRSTRPNRDRRSQKMGGTGLGPALVWSSFSLRYWTEERISVPHSRLFSLLIQTVLILSSLSSFLSPISRHL